MKNLLILFVCVFIQGCSLNEKLFEQGKVVEVFDNGNNFIETGQVMAYGEMLAPPYLVEMIDEKIFINEIQYFPKKLVSDVNKKKVVVTEFTIQKHEALMEIGDIYKKNLKTMNPISAIKALISDFQKGRLEKAFVISSMELQDDVLRIIFQNGEEERMLLNSFRIDRSEKQDYKEITIQKYQSVKNLLEEGWTIIFDYKKTEFIPPEN